MPTEKERRMMKKVIKQIRNLKHDTVNTSSIAKEPWEIAKTKHEAYNRGCTYGNYIRESDLTSTIKGLESEIEQLKKDREGARIFVKHALATHIGNATNDLSRLMKEI